MRIRLNDLVLSCKKGKEIVDFSDISYFYGQMGSGKSTIARLIDYCLGGNLGEDRMTPALQSEFVSVSLSLNIENYSLSLYRNRGEDLIRASWSNNVDAHEVIIPARKANGVVLPNTSVEVLSDLIFYLAGITPPKVRRSRIREDSELERLSIRDLLWYCYLDQDNIDSNFFHLDYNSEPFKKLKSKNVLRFLLGFHQEQVSELEVELETIRNERLNCEAGAHAIRKALSSAEIATEMELKEERTRIESEISLTDNEIHNIRNEMESLRSDAMEILRERLRKTDDRIKKLEISIRDLEDLINQDTAHKNELIQLSTKWRRSRSAYEVLSGVEFKNCPSCGKTLPQRSSETCAVCNQEHEDAIRETDDLQTIERDLHSRVEELTEIISEHEEALNKSNRQLRELYTEKAMFDEELNRASINYDSQYLSNALHFEKQRSALKQKLADLERLEILVQQIQELSDRANELSIEEKNIRSQLAIEREKAEKDFSNLNRLKNLFLDSLLKAKLPGINKTDRVEITEPHFLPEISSLDSGDLIALSFANIGSGGKKTLFKSCFAIAIHRLVTENEALLPSFMVIDTPMKNISPWENKEQFESFHNMIYELSQNELSQTQFIIIDKDFFPPPADNARSFFSRHMTPSDPENPPLISYYRGS